MVQVVEVLSDAWFWALALDVRSGGSGGAVAGGQAAQSGKSSAAKSCTSEQRHDRAKPQRWSVQGWQHESDRPGSKTRSGVCTGYISTCCCLAVVCSFNPEHFRCCTNVRSVCWLLQVGGRRTPNKLKSTKKAEKRIKAHAQCKHFLERLFWYWIKYYSK